LGVSRLAADDGDAASRGDHYQSQAGATADAAEGSRSIGAEAEDDEAGGRAQIFPYLLRELVIDRRNQVWAADIIYIPIGYGVLYLVAIIDWFSRPVLAWRLSNTMDTAFCVDALDEALARFGRPDIFNTDQGAQFTSAAFTGRLANADIRISMDGRGRRLDQPCSSNGCGGR
jgi:putative transposase